MRNGKNPNRNQKRLLKKNKKDWTEWLYIRPVHTDTGEKHQFRHKETNDIITL